MVPNWVTEKESQKRPGCLREKVGQSLDPDTNQNTFIHMPAPTGLLATTAEARDGVEEQCSGRHREIGDAPAPPDQLCIILGNRAGVRLGCGDPRAQGQRIDQLCVPLGH